MIFWSHTPETKEGKIKSRKERDRRVRAHQLHMGMVEEQRSNTADSMGSEQSQSASEGIDQDFASKVGRGKQVARELVNERSKQLGKMQARIRHSRMKTKSRGRSLGF